MALFTPLYNLPNQILEKQKMYQSDHRPIMLRGPRGKFYVGTFAAIFVVGMVGTTATSWQLIKGKD